MGEIKCPACGVIGYEYFSYQSRAGKRVEIVCNECGKYFNVSKEEYGILSKDRDLRKENERKQSTLIVEWDDNNSPSLIECPSCQSKGFDNFAVEGQKRNKGYFTCKSCGKYVSLDIIDYEKIRTHIQYLRKLKRKTEMSVLKCPDCGNENLDDFSNDKKSSASTGVIACKICGRYFTVNIKLYEDIKSNSLKRKSSEAKEKKEINDIMKSEYAYNNLNEKYSALDRKYKELLDKHFSQDELIDAIYQAVNKTDFNPPAFVNKLNITKRTETFANINISDVHYGLVCDPAKNRNINAYNKTIAIERLNYFINSSLEYINIYGSKYLQLNILGDTGNFNIHPSESDSTTTDSIVDIYSWMITTINFLVTQFEKINITFVAGNHEDIRKDSKPNVHNKIKENYEYLIGRLVKKYYEEHLFDSCKVTIDVPETFYTLNNMGGIKQLVLHGDVVKGGNSLMGIPSFGLIRLANRMDGLFNIENIVNDTNVKFDTCILGHFHRSFRLVDLLGRSIYVSGCVCGTDEFALNVIQSACLPEQTLLIFDDMGIMAEHNIRL